MGEQKEAKVKQRRQGGKKDTHLDKRVAKVGKRRSTEKTLSLPTF